MEKSAAAFLSASSATPSCLPAPIYTMIRMMMMVMMVTDGDDCDGGHEYDGDGKLMIAGMIFLFACTNLRDFEDEHGVISQIIFMMKVLMMILMILMMTMMMTLVVLMMMMMVTKERGASTCSHASVTAQHKFCKNYIQCKICVVYNMYFKISPLEM